MLELLMNWVWDYSREATECELLADCYSCGCKQCLYKNNIWLNLHQSFSGYL